MRLDHIAYRVKDRYKTAKFFEDTLGYTIGTEFQIEFDDGSTADCLALVPSETRSKETKEWVNTSDLCHERYKEGITDHYGVEKHITMHAPPEIFVSDGPVGSIVGEWILSKNKMHLPEGWYAGALPTD